MAGAANWHFPSVSDLNQRELHQLTDNTCDVIVWCKQQGLLASKRDCAACGAEMLEGADQKRSDGLLWRYRNNNCKCECSIREGSFLEIGPNWS